MPNDPTDRDNGATSDYCILNGREDARLSDVERLTMTGGASLDRLVHRLGRGLANVTLDSFAPGVDISTLKAGHIKLTLLRQAGEIARLFNAPQTPVTPVITPIHGFPDGGVFDLQFPSSFPEQGWIHDPAYVSTEENTTSYVRLWEHNTSLASRPTIVAIHGWTMGDQRVNSLTFLPGLFFSLGYNVALVELPFHGRRRPHGFPENIPLFPSADPVRTCMAMAHTLYDLRSLRLFLTKRGHSSTCCIGMSLGAYVGALWASLDRLDKAVFLVPLVSMGDMAFELFNRAGESSVSLEFLRDVFRDHSPLERSPATPQESIMVIGGEDDHLLPRTQIALLQAKWPQATFVWAQGGHAAPTNRGEAFDRIARFLAAQKN